MIWKTIWKKPFSVEKLDWARPQVIDEKGRFIPERNFPKTKEKIGGEIITYAELREIFRSVLCRSSEMRSHMDGGLGLK